MARCDYAFFEVDTRQFVIDEAGKGELRIAPKAKGIQDRLKVLLEWAEQGGIPELATTCIGSSKQATAGRVDDGFCHVPFDMAWDEIVGLEESRQVLIGRPCAGCREENKARRNIETFTHHQTVKQLIKGVDAACWVVAGASFDGCLRLTATGLREMGEEVLIIEDVTIPSPYSTEESMKETRAKLEGMGVRWMSLEAFLEMVAAGSAK